MVILYYTTQLHCHGTSSWIYPILYYLVNNWCEFKNEEISFILSRAVTIVMLKISTKFIWYDIFVNCNWVNPFQSNFSANRILPSSYLLWAGKRLVDYLLAVTCYMRKSVGLAPTAERANKCKKKVLDRLLQRSRRTNAKKKSVGCHPTSEQNGKIIMSDKVRHRIGKG